uniref:Uncharacterized protein n=1 Tax=Timema tahoe TaxID=61484 RepID=A0A7R9IAW9_9NEOP|nr:unnamed protein product [Timema tahoe]
MSEEEKLASLTHCHVFRSGYRTQGSGHCRLLWRPLVPIPPVAKIDRMQGSRGRAAPEGHSNISGYSEAGLTSPQLSLVVVVVVTCFGGGTVHRATLSQ